MCDTCSYFDTSQSSESFNQSRNHYRLDEDFEVDEYQPNDGLPADKIREFPTFEADDYHVYAGCTICIDGVHIGKRMMRLGCMHVYCEGCIREWFEKNSTCPQCRKRFGDEWIVCLSWFFWSIYKLKLVFVWTKCYKLIY